MEVEITKALPDDASALTMVAARTFFDDNRLKPKGASLEGPPGHDEEESHKRWIKQCHYFKAVCQGKIVGAVMALEKDESTFCVDGMFVDPELQNKGIGSKLMEKLMASCNPKYKWVLSTPDFSFRNHHFYEKFGFVKVGEEETGLGWNEYYYELQNNTN